VLFDLTKDRTMPASLQQQYLFMPAQVRRPQPSLAFNASR
jgi:hypothetical protein